MLLLLSSGQSIKAYRNYFPLKVQMKSRNIYIWVSDRIRLEKMGVKQLEELMRVSCHLFPFVIIDVIMMEFMS